MAKALYGYAIGTDSRVAAQLEAHNRLLRQRVSDLEALVTRLQAENDQLLAAASDEALERV